MHDQRVSRDGPQTKECVCECEGKGESNKIRERQGTTPLLVLSGSGNESSVRKFEMMKENAREPPSCRCFVAETVNRVVPHVARREHLATSEVVVA